MNNKIINIIENQLKCSKFAGAMQAKIELTEKIKNRNCWGIGHPCRFICRDGRYIDYEPGLSA